MISLQSLPEFAEFCAQLEALSVKGWAVIAFYGFCIVAALWLCGFVFKTLLVWGLRRLGCATPRLWYAFPAVPWRVFYRTYMTVRGWQESVFKLGKVSSGGFASVLSTLTNVYHRDMVPLGLAWIFGLSCYAYIGLNVKTHLQVIGSSGAGKSVWAKTLLSEWNNSAFVIDAKNGELSRDLAASDNKRQWVQLRPYDPDSSGQCNPLDCLHEAIESAGENEAIRVANRIGASFIETPPQSKQPFFTDTSRGYLVGLILFVYNQFPEDERNLGTVRDLIVHGLRVYNEDGSLESTSEEAIAYLQHRMMESTAFGGAIAGAAGPYINAGQETLGNLQATLQERTKILDIPSVRHMLARTTRPLRELKTCDDYVLVLDAQVSSIRGELKDLVRLLTNMVVYTFEVTQESKGSCLFLLDEFNAQGYNAQIEAFLPVARGHKAVIVILIQDLEGLKAAYPLTYRAFTGNSTATLWMSTAHPMNLIELSNTLGKKTLVIKDPHTGRKSYREVKVAEPDQLGRFLNEKSRNMIVTRAGARPLRLKLDPHYLALPVWRYTPDPDHKETFLRRVMRKMLARRLQHLQNTPTEGDQL
ncbi:MAG: type IV secretory system conjugative DNA transfer family protein [Neptuniibacter sp.]